MIHWNSHIDKYAGKIVRIECGNMRGTAFFIAPNLLLSAWHVVADIKFHEDVIAIIGNQRITCCVEELGHDVVLLNIKEFRLSDNDTPIPLLSSSFRTGAELEIIGYPQEIGCCEECIQTRIKNSKYFGCTRNHSYDSLAFTSDNFQFQSYSGFSGSPVVNSSGLIIGVATDQLNNSIGYTSIKSISDKLKENEIYVEENDDLYDDTPYGRGYAITKVQEALRKMSGRYGEIKVDNRLLTDKIIDFLGLKFEEKKKSVYAEFVDFCDDRRRTKLEIDTLFKKSEIKEYYDTGTCVNPKQFACNIENLLDERNDYCIKGKSYADLQKWYENYISIYYLDRIRNEKFKLVMGEAGCGKTHMLCRVADELKNQMNIYLFFGIDFGFCTPDETIMRIMEWSESNYLELLNEKMKKANQNALIIIDAINEGVGETYWKDNLSAFKNNLKRYEHIKLIVSVRTLSDNDLYQGLFDRNDLKCALNIVGFENVKEALKEYFYKYKINENIDKYKNISGFSNPLFLRLFCDSYYQLSSEERKFPNHLTIYNQHLQIRNRDISNKIGEDEYRQVLPVFLKRIAHISVECYQCGDVPNKVARKISYSICGNRIWNSSLMYQCLVENLLFRYGKNDDYGWVNFEFQQVGDFLKAEQILLIYPDSDSLLDYLNNILNTQPNNRSVKQTVIALLSIWNPSLEIWNNRILKNKILIPLLIESLKYRNLEQSDSTLRPEHIINCILSDNRYLDAQFLIKHIDLFTDELLGELHSHLLNMKMRDRDARWSVSVNRLLDNYKFQYIIDDFEGKYENETEKLLMVEIWMLTSSHPQIRHNIIRRIKKRLEHNTHLCETEIKNFHNVDDGYLLRGLFAAIYGVLLCKRDNKLTEDIAKSVYELLYQRPELVPQDIEVRHWTLKILEYAHSVNNISGYWIKARPPYKTSINVLDNLTEKFDDKNYFGNNYGATQIYHSLFGWDFSHYIIGTNWKNDSDVYYKNKRPVKLDSIIKATAHIIKHEYGYNATLDAYDSKLAWEECTPRKHERFGKKYEWLALGRVKANLCDTCQMCIDDWNNVFADIPYPWYDDYGIHFDPTIDMVDFEIKSDIKLFYKADNNNTEHIPVNQWLDEKKYLLPDRSILKDVSGSEWVILFGYDHHYEDFEKRDNFIFYNTCLVQKENSDNFKNWAEKQNFHGRWMPEGGDSNEFLWNEYPWSDSCVKHTSFDPIAIEEKQCPCKVYMPCVSQFQEDREEIDESEHFNITVQFPRIDLYEFLNVYNAERGVFREKGTDKIIAINRYIYGDSLNVFLIRRERLNDYLVSRGYELFYCLLAEKRVEIQRNKFEIRRYSSCLQYMIQGSPQAVQPWKNESEFPQDCL